MKLTTSILPTLKKQDVFDVVAWQLLRQNARAVGFGGVKCMYRAPDGKRCAIGWLIPDDLYAKTFEFLGVRDLAERLSVYSDRDSRTFSNFLYVNMTLLRDLQGLHDAYLPVEWAMRLRAVASIHGLDASVVTHCDRTFRQPMPAKVRKAEVITYLPAITGAAHGSEEREESREICSA